MPGTVGILPPEWKPPKSTIGARRDDAASLLPSRRRRPPPPREPAGDVFKRRALAFVIGVGVIVLLLLAVRGCLDARKERAYENYLRDLDSLVTTSSQLSDDFFQRFRDPGGPSQLEFQAQLGSSRGTSEDLLNRVQGLDAPDELSAAQADLELAFELRRDGVSSVVEQTEAALGDEGSHDATRQIATDMRQFLASDVLYARAQRRSTTCSRKKFDRRGAGVRLLARADRALARRSRDRDLLSQVAGETGQRATRHEAPSLSVTVRRGNVPLTPETLNTARPGPDRDRGRRPERRHDRRDRRIVAFELLGSTDRSRARRPSAGSAPHRGGTAAIPVNGEIPEGDDLTLIVTVYLGPGRIDRREQRGGVPGPLRRVEALTVEPLSVAFLGPAGTSRTTRCAPRAARACRRRPSARGDDPRRGDCSRCRRADRALVPFENSIEGSVRPTLDALAFDADTVSSAGEHDHEISQSLIAREEIELDHRGRPEPSAAERAMRSFPSRGAFEAEVRSTDSTAEAVRQVRSPTSAGRRLALLRRLRSTAA